MFSLITTTTKKSLENRVLSAFTFTSKVHMQQEWGEWNRSYSKQHDFRRYQSGLTDILCRSKFVLSLGSPHLTTYWTRKGRGSFLWQILVSTLWNLSLYKHRCKHSTSVTPTGINYKVLQTQKYFNRNNESEGFFLSFLETG